MDWVERLRILIGERKQKDFAAWLGESESRISNYLAGNNDHPAADFLVKLAEKGINVNWLLIGTGPIHAEEEPYGIPEPTQMLVKELADSPGMVPRLTEIVRRAKEVKQADDEVKSAFEGLKQAVKKKAAKRRN